MFKIRKRLEKLFGRKNVSSLTIFDNPIYDNSNLGPYVNDLNNLTYLNLSNCEIATLPRDFGDLPNLKQLVLSNNNLGSSDKFAWMEPTAIRNNLRFLNLSNNSLTNLPIFIGKLIALTELIVCHNSLRSLPQCIVNLRNLEVLIASYNDLLYLPGSITNMRLKILDISRNDFFTSNIITKHTQLLTLHSLAARAMLKNRSIYEKYQCKSLNTLLEDLEKTQYCLYCENPCFESYVMKFLNLNLYHIAATVIFDDIEKRKTLAFECYYCSLICCNLWWNRNVLGQHER